MYISAPNQSLTHQESVAAQTKKASSKKDPVVSIGAALLWPAMAIGSLTFSAGNSKQPTTAPYKTPIIN